MRAQEIRELSERELQERLRTTSRDLFDLRFAQASRQLDNPMRLRQLRREIARMKTILRERELAGEAEPEPAAPAPRRKK